MTVPALGLGGIGCDSCPHQASESFSDNSARACASGGHGDMVEDWFILSSDGLPSLRVTSSLWLTQAFEVGRHIWVVLVRDGPQRRPEKLWADAVSAGRSSAVAELWCWAASVAVSLLVPWCQWPAPGWRRLWKSSSVHPPAGRAPALVLQA